MAEVIFPRQAGQLIAETSKDVTVETKGVEKTAQLIINQTRSGKFGVNTWADHDLYPQTADKTAIDWIFFSDVLNFSFWSSDKKEKYRVRYKGKDYTGYWSLCAAINRALDVSEKAVVERELPDALEEIAITDPNYYASISLDDLKKIFRSDSLTEIPMLEERHQAITESGKVLIKKYQGSFVNCIKMCDGSAQKLLQLIVRDFPSFQDEADYNGKRVGFYKRAQILVADIWAACGEKGMGEFHDIDTITMFPDYRIPQVLAYYGALKYSDGLKSQLEKDNLLENGSRLEVEIRGCSIWAAELISKEVKKMAADDPDPKVNDISCNPIKVDYFLWDHRRECENDMDSTPFHKTRSIYY